MAEPANNPLPLEDEDQLQEETLSERFMDWVRTELVWYAGSFSFHLLALSLLLLLPNMGHQDNQGDAPVLQASADEDKKEVTKFDKFDIGDPPDKQPDVLDVNPTLEKLGHPAQEAEYNDDSKIFEHKGGGMVNGNKDTIGGGGGALAFGPGPKVTGALGIGTGLGTGTQWGSGGAGVGFGGRGTGHREAMLATGGGTKQTERAVTAALVWLAKHQDYNGDWNLKTFQQECKPGDKTCTGVGEDRARGRRDRDGPASLPRRRADAQDQRRLSRAYSQGPCLAHQSPAGRRQSGQGRAVHDVFARPGHDRPV